MKPNTIGLERNDVTDVQLKQEQERFELLEVGWSNRKAPSSHRDPKLLGPLAADDKIYLARKDGRINTVIIPAIAPDGYTTQIKILVGIHADGSIAGVRVTEHRETPGLGDKIETRKSDWIQGFNGLSLGNPAGEGWAVKKDGGQFDSFTGATITPRAVVSAVHRALLYFRDHKEPVFQAPATDDAPDSMREACRG